ncbi:MAG: hypothetical protein ACKVHU_20025, partial [Acidimicrobiales bacterium]
MVRRDAEFLGFGSGRAQILAAARIELSGRLPSTDLPLNEQSSPTGVDSARAWLIVLAAFLSTTTAFFVTYSFTTFLTAM